MKKVKKGYILSFLLGAIIFGGIGTVVAYTILAKDVSYTPNNTTWKVDNVKNALDDLYSKSNTTITGLNNQISTLQTSNTDLSNQVTVLTGEKANLQSQLDSLTTAARSFQLVSSTQPQTIPLGFKANYISCVGEIGADKFIIVYNNDYDSNVTIRGYKNVVEHTIGTWFTINSNNIVWNITSSNMSGITVYCSASK